LDELKKRRFVWGVVLAWAPWLPIPFGISSAFKSLSEQKATGLGVVAGGLTEKFVLLGISASLVSEVAAMVLLFRAFSPGHRARSLFSALSISLSGMTLLLIGLFFWFSWLPTHRNF
jgi:hypothetical protein